MPEFPSQSSPNLPGPDEEPPALPPVLGPEAWEDFPVFRETFLYYLSVPAHARAVRVVGGWLFDMVLECAGLWPGWPESATRMEVRAALADVRYLEGFLASVGREQHDAVLSRDDAALSQAASVQARELARIADALAAALEGSRP